MDKNTLNQHTRREDFFLLVKPYNDDAQSVTIRYSNDRSTEVSIDSNKVSKVTLNVIKSNGKLYYYYTLNGMKYPQGKSIEFKPFDGKKIYFLIGSSTRSDEKDKVGVNLTINNSSGTPMDVTIENEDSKMPRVVIVKKVGDVSVSN